MRNHSLSRRDDGYIEKKYDVCYMSFIYKKKLMYKYEERKLNMIDLKIS